MATITIRLDDGDRDDLDEIARTRGVSLSDLVRDQIGSLLGRDVPVRDDTPHALSFQQRQLLANQNEILSLLHAGDEHESGHHRAMAEVLREGYAGEYGSVFGGMEPEMSRSECKLAWDILDMYRILGASFERLSSGEQRAFDHGYADRLRFAGFDLSDAREGRLLYYVRFLVGSGRWEEIGPRLTEIGDNGNAHHRWLPAYERMLAVYTPIFEQLVRGARGHGPDGWLLSLEELLRVAQAWASPG